MRLGNGKMYKNSPQCEIWYTDQEISLCTLIRRYTDLFLKRENISAKMFPPKLFGRNFSVSFPPSLILFAFMVSSVSWLIGTFQPDPHDVMNSQQPNFS